MEFSEKLYEALRRDPAKLVMEYKGRQFTRREITDFGVKLVALLNEAGVPASAAAALVTRNRPLHAAAILGQVAEGRSFTTLYAFQSPELMASEVKKSRFAAVIADAEDWSPELMDQVRALGAVGVVLDMSADEPVRYLDGAAEFGVSDFYRIEGESGLQILSSGTTGRPKRIHFPFKFLKRAVESTAAGQLDSSCPPDITTWPFAGIGGLCNVVSNAMIDRYMVILDRFNVPEWVEAVKRYKPSYVSGPPAVAQMVVDAGVAPEDISSIRYLYGGSAPISDELCERLEQDYGIVVIWAYGATEFCGTIISWTAQMHEDYARSKKGAMGRALPGIEVRIVDVETGEPVPVGEQGYLEAHVPTVSDQWIRTTDLARVDEDGFFYHCGRGDGAIMRGGFKIIPEDVIDALKLHPSVLDAGVVGLDDPRVGQVPAAAVQLRTGAAPVAEGELGTFLRAHLKAPSIPAQFKIVQELPLTPSLKVDRRAVARLFDAEVSRAVS